MACRRQFRSRGRALAGGAHFSGFRLGTEFLHNGVFGPSGYSIGALTWRRLGQW